MLWIIRLSGVTADKGVTGYPLCCRAISPPAENSIFMQQKFPEMINRQLLDPRSIVVVGGSEDITKPGGKVLKNLIDGKFNGQLYVLNPKSDLVQGVPSFRDPEQMPPADLAVLAVAARHCPPVMQVLAEKKQTRAFIVLSAGFSEESQEGAELERQMVDIVNQVNGCLMGPNCIGFLNPAYHAVFTTPVPRLDPRGCDFISGSGGTAVFIMEAGIPKGLTFSSVYSVGNSAQMGVEDVLEYLDGCYVHGGSPPVKLLYLESIKKPDKLLRHASSLIRKGCRIAAIKAGSSEAGSRAASSHTGALAGSDEAVDALFRKAGIVRCYGREELTTVASVFMHPLPEGKRMAIITHAGGPAVLLTDALSAHGFEIPAIEGPAADRLLEKLYPGSSVTNPIDFLATGTAAQIEAILDACENDFGNIDAMTVIFGSPGLVPVDEVYEVIHRKMQTCRKPIYAVLPSVINAAGEIQRFLAKERIFFPDEVVFGHALARVLNAPPPAPADRQIPATDNAAIRRVIEQSDNGYLSPDATGRLLDAAGIPRVKEKTVSHAEELKEGLAETGFPLVMKVVGPVHKTDVGGVVLNVMNDREAGESFRRLMGISDARAVLLQPMAAGTELFAGVKREEPFGHLVLFGLGGIMIEVLKDVRQLLAPVSAEEVLGQIRQLRGYPLIKGLRGKAGVNEKLFAEVVSRLSALVSIAPEIFEMDINPLMGEGDRLVAVDARIRLEKQGNAGET